MKKMFALVSIIVVLSMLLVSCQEAPIPPIPDPTKSPQVEPPVVEKTNRELQNGKPFRFIGVNRNHPVVRTILLGWEDACKDLQVDCVNNAMEGVDFTNFPPLVDMAIAQGTSGAIAFFDLAVIEADKKLVNAGIPTMNIHTALTEDFVPGTLGWVAADATDYAIRTADLMGEKMGGKGVVAITQATLNDLENVVSAEFTKEMAKKYPDIVVLKPELEGVDPPAAIAVATTILQAHPEVTAAFGTTGASPTTWAKAAQAVGKKPGEIIIVGMDYTRQNLDLVKSGEVFALVGQPLYEETYKAVELLVAHMRGEEVPFANVFPAPLITIADVDKYYTYADRVDAQQP